MISKGVCDIIVISKGKQAFTSHEKTFNSIEQKDRFDNDYNDDLDSYEILNNQDENDFSTEMS